MLLPFVVLASLAAPPQGAAPRNDAAFDDAAKRAAAARDAGRLDEAVALYRTALKRRPTWAGGWWYLGTILYDQDRYAEARDAFRNLAPLERGKAAAWAMLGLCEFQTREYGAALADLRKALVLGVDDDEQVGPAVRYHAAILLTKAGQYETAFDTLRLLARRHHESEGVIVAFGIDVLRMPFLPSELPPANREAVLVAGRAAYNWAARNGTTARAAFEDLVSRFPRLPNAHYAFGTFLLDEDSDAALAEFAKELEISPAHVPSLLQIALERIKRGDYAAGLEPARQAESLAPANFIARNALGRILLETGDVAHAIEQLEAGVKLAPESAETHFALARAYARAGRPEDAARERAIFQKLEDARTKAHEADQGRREEPEGGSSTP